MRDAERPRVKWYDSRELSAAASVWLIVCCHATVGGRVWVRVWVRVTVWVWVRVRVWVWVWVTAPVWLLV